MKATTKPISVPALLIRATAESRRWCARAVTPEARARRFHALVVFLEKAASTARGQRDIAIRAMPSGLSLRKAAALVGCSYGVIDDARKEKVSVRE